MAFKTNFKIDKTNMARKGVNRGYIKTLVRLKKPVYNPLTKEQEQALFKEYEATKDPDIKEKIIKSNLRFCVSVCRSYRVEGVQEEDLFQVACMAITMAFDDFDYKRDNKFISYAVFLIRAKLIDYLNDNLNTIRSPFKRPRYDNLRKVIQEEYESGGSLSDVVTKLGVKYETAQGVAQSFKSFSMDAPLNDKGWTYKDALGVEDNSHNETYSIVNKCLSVVNPKSADMLQMKIALPPYNRVHTYSEIGEKYNCSRELVRQRINAALSKIKKSSYHHELR